MPGIKRNAKIHGGVWSKEDKQTAIESVLSYMLAGFAMSTGCIKVGVSPRTFEKWVPADPDLKEQVVNIVSARDHKARLRPTKITPAEVRLFLNSSLRADFDELMDEGKTKAAWLMVYRATKDRLAACRGCDVPTRDVMLWLKDDADFAEDVEEIETEKQWQIEDLYWRRAAIFKDPAALKALVTKGEKVGKRQNGTVNPASIPAPDIHFHISAKNGDRVRERLEATFGSNAKQLPDSADPQGVHGAGQDVIELRPDSEGGNGTGTVNQ